MNVIPLFSTPIYHIDDTGFRCLEKEFESIDRLKYVTPAVKTCLLSKDVHIFKLNYFSRIKKECEKHLKTYTKEVLGIKQDFYITNSWITRKSLRSGYKQHHIHVHPNSIFSGAFYLKVEDGIDRKLWFQSPHLNSFEYHYRDINVLNAASWWMPVNVGTCIIFPSQTPHYVEEIETDGERIVLAFNCFVKGKLGGKAYASDILL
jgi:uncharacterized protein (TIGR02466 family)